MARIVLDLSLRSVGPSQRNPLVMFHAVITPRDVSRGLSVELSGESVPYDLQMLREQLLSMLRRRGSLILQLRAAAEFRPRILAGLGDLGRRGVNVVFEGQP